jgi:hypothetical protein
MTWIARARAFGGISTATRDFSLIIVKVCVVAVVVIILRGVFWFFHMLFVRPFFDPLRKLPGPQGAILQSHLREVMEYV